MNLNLKKSGTDEGGSLFHERGRLFGSGKCHSRHILGELPLPGSSSNRHTHFSCSLLIHFISSSFLSHLPLYVLYMHYYDFDQLLIYWIFGSFPIQKKRFISLVAAFQSTNTITDFFFFTCHTIYETFCHSMNTDKYLQYVNQMRQVAGIIHFSLFTFFAT